MSRTLAVCVGLCLLLAFAAPSRAIAQASPGWILWEKNIKAKGGVECASQADSIHGPNPEQP